MHEPRRRNILDTSVYRMRRITAGWRRLAWPGPLCGSAPTPAPTVLRSDCASFAWLAQHAHHPRGSQFSSPQPHDSLSHARGTGTQDWKRTRPSPAVHGCKGIAVVSQIAVLAAKCAASRTAGVHCAAHAHAETDRHVSGSGARAAWATGAMSLPLSSC